MNIQILKRFANNPNAYFKRLKLYLAGLYFDYVQKNYKVLGFSFEVPMEYTDRVDRGYFALGAYEKAECDLAQKLLTRECAVLELGGCIGVVSCITNRLLTEPANHVVVEANPQLIPYITRNREKNGCKFKIVNGAITFQKEINFFFGKSMVLGGVCQNGGRSVSVKGFTFSEIEDQHGIRFDTIIMDIEGGEYDLIKENEAFFKGLRNIIMENHPEVISKAKRLEYESQLTAAGFTKTHELGQVTAWQKL